MAEDSIKKEDQLFLHLVSTFAQSAWISLGKIKNPVSDKTERNLEQATFYIDLLDMLQKKMKGNLTEWEEQFILHSVSELKLNYLDEKKKEPTVPAESSPEEKADKKTSKGSKSTKESEKPVKKKKEKQKPPNKRKSDK
ncbi:MAG: DUF1844 domain-containing protein [Fidelibacterota bacterium]